MFSFFVQVYFSDLSFFFFFFNDTATTEIYTLSLHDALPISRPGHARRARGRDGAARRGVGEPVLERQSRRRGGGGVQGRLAQAVRRTAVEPDRPYSGEDLARDHHRPDARRRRPARPAAVHRVGLERGAAVPAAVAEIPHRRGGAPSPPHVRG